MGDFSKKMAPRIWISPAEMERGVKSLGINPQRHVKCHEFGMNLAFTIPKFMGSIILTYTPWKTVMSSCVKTLGFNANKVKQGPFWIGTQTAKCRAKPGPRSRYGLRVKWSNDPAMLFFTLKCTFFYGLLVLQRPGQISSLLRRTWVAWFTAKSTAGMLAQVAEVICGVSKFCSFLKALNHPSWGVDRPKKLAIYYVLTHTYRWDQHPR